MSNRLSFGGVLVIAVIILFLMYSACSGSNSSYSSSSSSYSNRRSGIPPTCPPVNRELPMSEETAKRLSGTGYGGTRPNTSAENTALRAAQLKCKNCGYHTDNGSNSLCDYCQWMERYGGGLPTNRYTTAKPKTTTKATAKPKTTSAPKKSDPYNASDYSHVDDFYYDHYDDFFDYEDAEEYFDAHN